MKPDGFVCECDKCGSVWHSSETSHCVCYQFKPTPPADAVREWTLECCHMCLAPKDFDLSDRHLRCQTPDCVNAGKTNSSAAFRPFIERSAYEKACKERDALKAAHEELLSYLPKVPTQPYEKEVAQKLTLAKAALEEIAHVRCSWQLSQDIARKALAEIEPTLPPFTVAGNPSDSECAGER